MSAARDRALVALAGNREFAQSIARMLQYRTALVVVARDRTAVASFVPGPTRGRAVVRFEGEPEEATLTGSAMRRLFLR